MSNKVYIIVTDTTLDVVPNASTGNYAAAEISENHNAEAVKGKLKDRINSGNSTAFNSSDAVAMTPV